MKYRHKKLWWIAEEDNTYEKCYEIYNGKSRMESWIHTELIEDSLDREKIKESKVPDAVDECDIFDYDDEKCALIGLIRLRNETRKRCGDWKMNESNVRYVVFIMIWYRKISLDFLSFPTEEIHDEFNRKHRDKIEKLKGLCQ